MPVDDYQTVSDAVSLWEHLMAGVMIALSFADVVAFVFEWREHRKWTRTAKAEAFALVLFVALGLGDWHVMSLQERREQLAEQKAYAETVKVTANVDALKADLARRDEELAPFIKLAESSYPNADVPTGLGKLASEVDGLRDQVAKEGASSDAFKKVTELSEEALAGSRDSYEKLAVLGREPSELGARALARLKYIESELAYYEQPPGAVLATDLSITPDGGKPVRLVEYPTCSLILALEEKDISNTTRFSVMNDICRKPVAEVDAGAMGLLQHARYLPAVAATTSILRRLHGHERPFMDSNGWIAYLQGHDAGALASPCYP
jgi:hypothetical protein